MIQLEYLTQMRLTNVCPKMKNVLALCGARNVYKVESGNSKLNLTVLFTFSASGVTTPLRIAFP